MKTKLQIKTWGGTLLFEYESEDNTLRKTLEAAVNSGADLSRANLSRADLSGANLSRADLSGANLSRANLSRANLSRANLSRADLSGANLSRADLSGANLSRANLSRANLSRANLSRANLSRANLSRANLSGADLSGADLSRAKPIPQEYINLCSRDILFIFEHLKPELPAFREKLIAGQIDGTMYEGDCACLIGTLGNVNGGIEKVCAAIPYYDKGLHNYGEQWFWQIRRGDTPEKNEFAAHALKLLDQVLGTPVKASKKIKAPRK